MPSRGPPRCGCLPMNVFSAWVQRPPPKSGFTAHSGPPFQEERASYPSPRFPGGRLSCLPWKPVGREPDKECTSGEQTHV